MRRATRIGIVRRARAETDAGDLPWRGAWCARAALAVIATGPPGGHVADARATLRAARTRALADVQLGAPRADRRLVEDAVLHPGGRPLLKEPRAASLAVGVEFIAGWSATATRLDEEFVFASTPWGTTHPRAEPGFWSVAGPEGLVGWGTAAGGSAPAELGPERAERKAPDG
ncbi:hypothetical protein AB0E10_13750 [Streptomyces sp. NPDC048045]|uniref:hypothetical protein n=1 Tax=Streptomyces sp. NPDC048045 TaxID=3154710 RepID=UPI00342337C6